MTPRATADKAPGATEVVMPRLSESMEEGVILSWLKPAGEWVEREEDLAEIEADKATATYSAEAEGYLEITVGEGEAVEVGRPIARLWPERDQAGGPDRAAGPEARTQTERRAGRMRAEGPASGGRGAGGESPAVPASPTARADGAQRASPLARRLAELNGIDLATVEGSGPSGRVIRSDVEAVLAPRMPAPPAPARRSTAGASGDRGLDRDGAWFEEPTAMQRSIAERMVESKLTAPDFGLLVDADMGAALELRADLSGGEGGGGPVPSLNDLVIKAAARALTEFPRANGSFREGRFELHEHVNVGFAVAVTDGLLVPTIRDADRKSVGEIAAETRDLAEQARARTIEAAALSGGTFTVTNLGMYGVKAILPVINPGEAAILGVGALEQRVVAIDGAPGVRPRMSLSLICDHRILYGAEAARFLMHVRSFLEQPLRLIL